MSEYTKQKDKIRVNPYFYKDGELRKDLDKEDFELWQKHFLENEIGCKNFVCVHDSDHCGIDYLCYISNYNTYKHNYVRLEESVKCGLFDKAWLINGKGKPQYSRNEKDWRGFVPKEACLECTASHGVFTQEISKEEYEKLKKARYIKLYHNKATEPGKEDYYSIHYYKSWCKELNDFMLERGYIVNREFEKYKDNVFFKALAHSLPGDAEAKILKFQVEAPKVLKKFFDKLGLADLLKEED